MPTYISLLSYTEQGVRSMKDSPNRLQKATEAIKGSGGQLKSFHLTLGSYDAVVIADFPDDVVAARTLLQIAQAGAIRTETLRAFDDAEYRSIVGGLK
jgi:uncharacterized protein with GYD domain